MSDAAIVTVADDRIEYRASALGGCDLALLAARLEYEPVPVKPDAKIMQVFAAGHRIEDEVINELYPHGLLFRQHRVVVPISRRLFVVGHIDGYEQSIIEVKSQNQEEWDRFNEHGWDAGFFPKYKWQASAYMLGFNENELLHWRSNEGPSLKLIRALRDDEGNWTGDYHESWIHEPFYTIADMRRRILNIEAAAATGVLVAECTPSFPCPYFYLHEEVDRELVTDEAVDILAREYAYAQRDEATAKGKKANARTALRQAVDGDKHRTHTGVNITFYTQSNPPQLDKEGITTFLKEHDRSLDEFMTTSKGQRLRVTLPKEDDEPSSADKEA